jgi:hypothetical protein
MINAMVKFSYKLTVLRGYLFEQGGAAGAKRAAQKLRVYF